MICSKCGAVLEDGARFCLNCGAALQNKIPAGNTGSPYGRSEPVFPGEIRTQPAQPGYSQPQYQTYQQPFTAPCQSAPGYQNPGNAPAKKRRGAKKKKQRTDPVLVAVLASIAIGIALAFVLVFRFIIFADLGKKAEVGIGKGAGRDKQNKNSISAMAAPEDCLWGGLFSRK